MAEAEGTRYPVLTGGRYTDVVVIGAGLAGMTAAWKCRQAGLEVIVLEQDRIAAGMTGRSSGSLTLGGDFSLHQMIRRLGPDAAWDVLAAQRQAMLDIQEDCRRLGMQQHFRPIPAYLFAEDRAGRADLGREVLAARSMSLSPIRLNRAPLPFPVEGAVKLPDQACLAASHYLAGLAHAFVSRGGLIHEASPMERLEEKKHAVAVFTPEGLVKARNAVIAAHHALIGSGRLSAFRSCVLTVRLKSSLPEACFWDMRDPGHWIRSGFARDPGLMIVRGEDQRQGRPIGESIRRLESYVRQRFPVDRIERRSSYTWYGGPDRLPRVGRVQGYANVYHATGLGRQGLIMAAAAGQVLADLIQGNPNRAAEWFTGSRTGFRHWWKLW